MFDLLIKLFEGNIYKPVPIINEKEKERITDINNCIYILKKIRLS
tara:strand:- start:14094 stop:14228 length:135 start_codon:yes stop_codon:yes gene_type:complete